MAESEGGLVRALCERFGIALSAHAADAETAESRRVEHDARFLALSIPLDKARRCKPSSSNHRFLQSSFPPIIASAWCLHCLVLVLAFPAQSATQVALSLAKEMGRW